MAASRWVALCWMSLLVAAPNVMGLFAIGCGGGDGPVDVSSANVRGFWFGARDGEDGLGRGPVMLHLGGALPGLADVTQGFEAIEFAGGPNSTQAGQYRVEDGALVLEDLTGVSFSAPLRLPIVRLTRDELILDMAEWSPAPGELTLKRGDSCEASAAWISQQTFLGAAGFGPDGRLHAVHGTRGYTFSHPAQCLPMVAPEIQGHAISVSNDNAVRVAHMRRDDDEGEARGIYVTEFSADAPVSGEFEFITTKLSDAITTYVFPNLYAQHLSDGTPVVIYLAGNQLLAWHKVTGGDWEQSEATLPGVDLLTPPFVSPVPTHDGELILHLGGRDALRFNGTTWQPWTIPAHPELGEPTVFTFDADGGFHGAWMRSRGVYADIATDVWDHLMVGRQLEDNTWETAGAGVGFPSNLRVNTDGSYDVVAIMQRDQDAIGWVHVDADLSPGGWVTSVGIDSMSGVSAPRTNYLARRVDSDMLHFGWGAFSPDGALLIGGGGVGGPNMVLQGAGAIRNPNAERQGRPNNAILSVTIDKEISGRVVFPTLDAQCDDACELPVADDHVLPVIVESPGSAELTVTTNIGLGSGLVTSLPDGSYALGIVTDGQGDDPHTVHLRVAFVSRLAEDAALLDELPVDNASAPVAAVTDGNEGAFVISSYSGLGSVLEHRGPDGDLLAGQSIGGSSLVPPLLSALENGGLLARGNFSEGWPEQGLSGSNDGLVWFDADLRPRAIVPIPSRNPRPHSMVLTADGRALEARVNFRSVEFTVFEEDGTTSAFNAPLPALERFIAVGDTIVATFETTSNAANYPLGDITLDMNSRVLVGIDMQGQVLWHVTTQRTLVEAFELAATADHLAIAMRVAAGQSWSAHDGYDDLPVTNTTAISYIMQIDPITGRVLQHATHPLFELRSSMLATDDGVVMSTSDAGHIDLSALSWSGQRRARTYTSRVGGQCVFQSCSDRETFMVPRENGRIAAYFVQGGNALNLDGLTLPGTSQTTAYLRWNAFGALE